MCEPISCILLCGYLYLKSQNTTTNYTQAPKPATRHVSHGGAVSMPRGVEKNDVNVDVNFVCVDYTGGDSGGYSGGDSGGYAGGDKGGY